MANNNEPLGNMIVGLSMDGSAFNNSLTSIKKELKVAQSALKANLAVVSASGDAYQTLEAKIRGMSDVAKVNAKQIDLLRDKHLKAIETYGEGSEQVHRLANQINNAVAKQASWTKQIKDSQIALQKLDYDSKVTKTSVIKFHESLDKVKSKAKSMSQTLTKAFTAPSLAIGGMSLAVSTEMTKVETRIQAMVTSSKKEIKKLKDSINDVYKTGVTSDTEELTNIASRVKQRGISDKDQSKAIKYATVLAKNTGQEGKYIVDVMSMLQNKFGMNINKSADYTQRIVQSGIEDLDQAMEYIPQLKDGGLSINEIIARLEGGMKSGAWNSDKTLDLLAEGQKKIVSDGSEKYKKFGLTNAYNQFQAGDIDYKGFLKEAKKKADKLPKEDKKAFWASIFGTQGEDIDLGSINGIFDANAKNGKAKRGSANELVKAEQEKAITRLTASTNKLKLSLLPLGNTLMNLGADVIEKLTPKIEKVANWFNHLSEKGQLTTLTFAGIGIAIAPNVKVLGLFLRPLGLIKNLFDKIPNKGEKFKKVFDVIKNSISKVTPSANTFKKIGSTITKVFKGFGNLGTKAIVGSFNLLSKGFWKVVNVGKILAPFLRVGLGTAFRVLTGPIGWVITGISLLTAGFKYAYKHSEKFRNFVDKLKDTIVRVWNKISKLGVKGTIKLMWSYTMTKFKNGVSYLKNKIDNIVDKIKNVPNRISKALSNGRNAVKEGAKKLGNGIIEGIEWGVNKAIGGVNWVLKNLGSEKHIANWEAPRFAKGTNALGHKGGLAWIGDGKKHELVQLPNGKMFLSPNKDTLVNLPKGTHVLSGDKTEKMFGRIPKFAKGTGWLDSVIGGAKATFNKVKDWSTDIWEWVSDKASIRKLLINKIGQSMPLFTGLPLTLAKGTIKQVVDVAKSFLFDESSISIPTGGTGVDRWKGIVTRALKMTGQFSPSNLKRTLYQMQTESGGNPKAINLWDSNAKKGTPSKGLMQVIDPTFKAHAMKGYNKNIYDPLSNIIASIRYAVSRYGSLAKAYKGHGYANGGLVLNDQIARIAEQNNPEMIIPLSRTKRTRAYQLLSKTASFLGLNNENNTNTNNNDLVQIISRQDQQITLMQQQLNVMMAILAKDTDVYLDGKQLKKSIDNITNKQNKLYNLARGLT